MIRPIRPEDVPAVLGLIRELADYELEPDAVETTKHNLRSALFAERPSVYAHVAVERNDGANVPGGTGGAGYTDGEVVGAAVWYVSFSTWTGRHGIHLVDLVVSAPARGNGHGRALFGELVRICTERGYARLDWEVLDALIDRDHRRGPTGVYLRQGGSPRGGWTAWRMDAEALSRVVGA